MVSLLASPAVLLAKNNSLFTRVPEVKAVTNSQVMPILSAYHNANPTHLALAFSAIVDDTTLAPNTEDGSAFVEGGSSGTGQISTYVVRSGDTIGSIANMFGVSTNTIRWANNLSGNSLKVGQELVILPVSGVRHTVKSGDTVASIAKKYKADTQDIIAYNGLEGQKLAVGLEIIIPDGEMTGTTKSSTQIVKGLKEIAGYYLRPIVGGRKSQNIHGHNAVDLAAPVGTPILASADGIVLVSRTGGWNGGYGTYIVVSHANGTQTVYGHMSDNYVRVGQKVAQGELIGRVGMTGNTSGPHVHFEIRGARNPF